MYAFTHTYINRNMYYIFSCVLF